MSEKSSSKRPPSVSLVGWCLLGIGALGIIAGLIAMLMMRSSSEIRSTYTYYLPANPYAMNVLNGVVFTIIGYAVLHGYSWSRWAYAIYMPVMNVASRLLTRSIAVNYIFLIIGLSIYVVFVILLFRRNATRFFCLKGDGAVE